MSMVNIIKQISHGERQASQEMKFMFGEVTSMDPLTIRVDNRFDITGSMIVLMKHLRPGAYPTHYHTFFRDGEVTMPSDGHAHELRPDYMTRDDATSEIYYGLQVGEKLVLLRNLGGQTFLILGRL